MIDFSRIGGVVIPMVTPLTIQFEIDIAAVERIIDRFIDATTFPFILGTTGEAALIPPETKLEMVRFVGKQYAGKTTLYAGITAPSLAETIRNGKAYADAGIDIAVAAPPGGYPLGASEQLRFYEAVADNLPIPLFIYNIPQTTRISLDLEAIDQLSAHPNIVGLKDSEANATRQAWALNQWKGRRDFAYFAGSSATSAHCLLNGGQGIVPSAGNLVPELYADLYEAATRGDAERAHQLQITTDEITAMYAAGQPLNRSLPRLKAVMEIMGLCGATAMPPFEQTDHLAKSQIEEAMRNHPSLLHNFQLT